ncbi:MAG: hypothetical protein J0I45_16250 [Bosea sp.]|nr:hypothetical protein [Bosea sp. (in: a-proteobacteria)]
MTSVGQRVTDPNILKQFQASPGKPVTDPAVLRAFGLPVPDGATTDTTISPNNVMRSVATGVPVVGGLLNKMEAATNATLAPAVEWMLPRSPNDIAQKGESWGERYDKSLAIQNAMDTNYAAEHPVASTAGNVGGAILGTAPLVAAAPAAFGVSKAPLAERAIMGSISGGALGGADAAVRSEGDPTAALVGAGVGAGVGAVAPYAGRLIGKGASKVADLFANRGSQFGSRTIQQLTNDLAAEGLTMPEIQARLDKLGPEGMLADTAESLRLRAEQLAQSDNPARPAVIGALKDRAANAGDRIASAFDASLGERPNVYETLKKMTAARKASADVLYGQARAEAGPIDVSRVIQAIDDEVAPGVNQIVSGKEGPGLLDETDRALLWVRSRMTNGQSVVTDFDRLHQLQRKIAEKATAAAKRGDNYQAGMLRDTRNKLLEAIEDAAPTYQQARQTFSSDSAVKDAFEEGQKIFSSKVHPDMLQADIGAMSKAEREAYQLGTRAAVDEAMGRVRNGALKGRTLLDADWNAEKLKYVLGRDKAQTLIDALTGEQSMAETGNQALANSATARRALGNPFAPQTALSTDTPGAIRSLLNMKAGDAAAKIPSLIGSAIEKRGVNSLAKELGPALVARGAERDAIVDDLLRQIERNQVTGAIDRGTERAVQAALLLAGRPASEQTLVGRGNGTRTIPASP